MMTMLRRLLFFTLFISANLIADEVHAFQGKHFLASYLECDHEALANLEGLRHAMKEAVDASGSHILDSCEYVFPPDGLTLVILLSESHASIHTYPEYNACFVDLFTCGESRSLDAFDAVLRTYLRPQTVETKFFVRGHGFQELP